MPPGIIHASREVVEWFGSIELKPFMFFDRNPGLDISDAE